jgi:hypothetical protein
MKVEFEGAVHEFPDDFTDAEVQAALSGAAAAPASPQQAAPSAPFKALFSPVARGEAGLQMLSGMGSGILSGLAGMARGQTGTQDDAADTVRAVQEKLTYQPRTKAGSDLAAALAQVLAVPAEVANVAGERATDATGSPEVGVAANVGVQAIPALLGSKGAAMRRQSIAKRDAPTAVFDATKRELVDAGAVIPPSELVQSAPAKATLGVLESIGGKAGMQQSASKRNIAVLGDEVRKDIGLKGKGQISADDLDLAKEPHFKVYEDAAGVSQQAAEAVKAWRQANYEAKRQNAYFRASKNPAAEDAAKAAQQEAVNQMAVIEAEAVKAGKPELAGSLKQARVELGKIGTVEAALNEATGELSAASLKRAQDRGVPLKGGMATMAKMSRAFGNKLTQPNVMQPGVNQLQPMAAATIAALRGNVRDLGLLGVPPLVRSVLLSRPVQQMAKPGRTPPPLSNLSQAQRAAIIAALQQQGATDAP